MPKENTRDSSGFQVEVTWHRYDQEGSGYLQIAVTAPDQIRRSIEMLRGLGYDVVAAGAEERDLHELATEVEGKSGPTGWGTMYATFDNTDRASVNRVIRSMKIARDGAFGRDE